MATCLACDWFWTILRRKVAREENSSSRVGLQDLDILRSRQNSTFLNGNWETKGNFKERSQNTCRAFVAKLRSKTLMFTCVVQGEVRHVLSVKILVSSEMKAYLQLRSEELGLPLRCQDAQQDPSQQPQRVSYGVPCWAWKQLCLQNRT